MGKILGKVEEFLVTDGWTYEAVPERDAFACGLKGRNASYRLFFDVDEEDSLLMLYLVAQVSVPEERRSPAAEFFTRANWGLRIGNFELDLRDGEVRYKVSVDVEGGEIVAKMVENMIGAAVSTMDRYFPGLMAVAYAGESPQDAVEAVERGRSDDEEG